MAPATASSHLTGPLHYDPEEYFHRIGLIVLSSDLTSEHDFFSMCNDPQIRLHVSRTPYDNPVTKDTLKAMEAGLATSAELLDSTLKYDAIYFACTSASAVLGDKVVEQRIQSVKPSTPVITPLTAATVAFTQLECNKISVLTPYTADVAETVASYFENSGFSVLNTCYLGLNDDRVMARITPESIIECAEKAVHPEAEALFISCTALRSAQIVEKIEQSIGRPVVTSNQGAVWRAKQLTGITSTLSGRYGKLWSLL